MPSLTSKAENILRHDWPYGSLTLRSLAAALDPVEFVLPRAKRVVPFHTTPWIAENRMLDPPLLNTIRGDWSCLPFGIPYADPKAFVAEWQPTVEAAYPPAADVLASRFEVPHGHASNLPWTLTAHDDGVSARLEYPQETGIDTVERRVRGLAGQAAIEVSFSVTARRTVRTTYGFHPTFALPTSGQAEIIPGDFAHGLTHPCQFEPGVSRIMPGARFTSLRDVPLASGGTGDFSRLPVAGNTEELLLLVGSGGMVELRDAGLAVGYRLSWDASILPHVVLWISNRGRAFAPWESRNLCVGIEPVLAAFELGAAISATDNPINALGYPTTLTVAPGAPWTAAFRLEAFDL